ncbi:hypothetical protein PhCBS80983_g03002 [Powellomyces hirtus]|uniref:BTB domain-containing protein n=1 Tax=Powellomyces hirtus TaxID=109895 RepID=A0A507E3H5_9FUNG|nr:hypothetical protein PhCBS80983_g03002 [Powellomyces hirtus]
MISASSSPLLDSPAAETAPIISRSQQDHTDDSSQQQQQGLLNSGYHDEICHHLYHNGYIRGLYADLIVHLQTNAGSPSLDGTGGVVLFKLHRIMAIRSPYFAHLLAEMEEANASNSGSEFQPVVTLTIPAHDPNLTPEGFSIALSGLYASYPQALLTDPSSSASNNQQRSTLLRSVLCAATLLQLHQLAALATAQIKQDISRATVLEYCHFVSQPDFQLNYGHHTAMELREAVLIYLTKGVVQDVCDQHGIAAVWSDRDGAAYRDLVATFAKLPFEWLKKVVESRAFKVPGEMDRFQFAKEIVATRQRARTSSSPNSPPASMATLLLAGEENVLLAFGSKDRTGVTIVRKAPRHHHHHNHHHHNSNLYHFNHSGASQNGSTPPSPPNSSTQQLLHNIAPHPMSGHNSARGMAGGYPGERRVWKASH